MAATERRGNFLTIGLVVIASVILLYVLHGIFGWLLFASMLDDTMGVEREHTAFNWKAPPHWIFLGIIAIGLIFALRYRERRS